MCKMHSTRCTWIHFLGDGFFGGVGFSFGNGFFGVFGGVWVFDSNEIRFSAAVALGGLVEAPATTLKKTDIDRTSYSNIVFSLGSRESMYKQCTGWTHTAALSAFCRSASAFFCRVL